MVRNAWFEALIGPSDSKIGKKRATLFYMQPQKFFTEVCYFFREDTKGLLMALKDPDELQTSNEKKSGQEIYSQISLFQT